MTKRKLTIVDRLGCSSFYDILDGKTFDGVIEHMKQLKVAYAGRDVFFEVQGYGYDGGVELYLCESRPETDAEYEHRIAEEKKRQAKKRAAAKAKQDREYAEYIRLKEKFGGIV